MRRDVRDPPGVRPALNEASQTFWVRGTFLPTTVDWSPAMTSARLYFAVPLLALALSCLSSTAPAASRAPLELSRNGKELLLTVRNTGTKPLLFFRPANPALWSGWTLEIRGPKGRFGFVTAPSPFVAAPDAFQVLQPGETFSKSLDLSQVVSFDLLPSSGEERSLLKLLGTYHATLAYTFDLAEATKAKDSPMLAQAFAGLAALKPPYEPMPPARASVVFTVK